MHKNKFRNSIVSQIKNRPKKRSKIQTKIEDQKRKYEQLPTIKMQVLLSTIQI